MESRETVGEQVEVKKEEEEWVQGMQGHAGVVGWRWRGEGRDGEAGHTGQKECRRGEWRWVLSQCLCDERWFVLEAGLNRPPGIQLLFFSLPQGLQTRQSTCDLIPHSPAGRFHHEG